MKSQQKFSLSLIVLISIFLRFYLLGSNPPALYWDEASLGYNAYAIWTQGVDEHGEKYPLARFIAFGDYKPPGYIYATVPFFTIFGVSELAIRFPSAITGVVLVLLTYLLTVELTKNRNIGLMAAAILAVSPWSLQLSRAAFEAHLAAGFNLLAIYLFLKSLRRAYLLPLSFVFFMLAFYTFNANRILSPLFILFLSIIYIRNIWQKKWWYVVACIISLFLLLPSNDYLQSRESRLRLQEVSIFTSLDTVRTANARQARAGNTWWAKIIHNRRIYFTRDYLKHYLDHFRGDFLFIKGDRNPRLSTQDVGELYLFELPWLVVGLIVLLKHKSRQAALLLSWLLLVPIPAATARETPHMLRIASSLPAWQIIAAVGGYSIWKWLALNKQQLKYSLMGLWGVLIIFCLSYYFHNYWIHYPRDWNSEWQYGYKQMVEKVRALENNYDQIQVTSQFGRPYIYFLLYNQIPPREYVASRNADRDWFGLWNVYGFGKYNFANTPIHTEQKILRVDAAGTFASQGKVIDVVTDPNGQVIFEIREP